MDFSTFYENKTLNDIMVKQNNGVNYISSTSLPPSVWDPLLPKEPPLGNWFKADEQKVANFQKWKGVIKLGGAAIEKWENASPPPTHKWVHKCVHNKYAMNYADFGYSKAVCDQLNLIEDFAVHERLFACLVRYVIEDVYKQVGSYSEVPSFMLPPDAPESSKAGASSEAPVIEETKYQPPSVEPEQGFTEVGSRRKSKGKTPLLVPLPPKQPGKFVKVEGVIVPEGFLASCLPKQAVLCILEARKARKEQIIKKAKALARAAEIEDPTIVGVSFKAWLMGLTAYMSHATPEVLELSGRMLGETMGVLAKGRTHVLPTLRSRYQLAWNFVRAPSKMVELPPVIAKDGTITNPGVTERLKSVATSTVQEGKSYAAAAASTTASSIKTRVGNTTKVGKVKVSNLNKLVVEKGKSLWTKVRCFFKDHQIEFVTEDGKTHIKKQAKTLKRLITDTFHIISSPFVSGFKSVMSWFSR